ncbi:MAG: adenylosuccinate synthase [Spirochaetales bacterium]
MNIVVIGAQWGDEGKGKIVDFLAEDAQLVVRFSGGANAGHTIVSESATYKLHLIPSGILYPRCQVLLGTGMVIDPEAFFQELSTLTEQGIDWSGRVFISDRAHLVLPRYRTLDKDLEKNRRIPIGTTGRGIGIAYSLKASRDGIRIADLYDSSVYTTLLEEDRKFLELYRDKLKPMVVQAVQFMHRHRGSRILFEGAQGTLLDLDWGTYPFVSSGVSVAAGATLGGGIGPRKIDRVLGVCKAYSTRVGNGPFPTEFKPETDGDLGDRIRELGREYGVTTGRPRRCGFLDLVALRYSCRLNSLDGLALTHLDVYDSFDEIRVCNAYDIEGEKVIDFPSQIGALNKAIPITKSFKGWKQSIGEVTRFEDLPREAKVYLQYIEEETETPIEIISVGYKRTQTIVRKNLWTVS